MLHCRELESEMASSVFGIIPNDEVTTTSDEGSETGEIFELNPREFPPLPPLTERTMTKSPIFMHLQSNRGSGAITKNTPQEKESDKDKENERRSLGETTQGIVKKLRGREYIAKVPKIPTTRKKPYNKEPIMEVAKTSQKEESKPLSKDRGLSPIGVDKKRTEAQEILSGIQPDENRNEKNSKHTSTETSSKTIP